MAYDKRQSTSDLFDQTHPYDHDHDGLSYCMIGSTVSFLIIALFVLTFILPWAYMDDALAIPYMDKCTEIPLECEKEYPLDYFESDLQTNFTKAYYEQYQACACAPCLAIPITSCQYINCALDFTGCHPVSKLEETSTPQTFEVKSLKNANCVIRWKQDDEECIEGYVLL